MPRTSVFADTPRAAARRVLLPAASLWIGFCAAMADGPVAWGWLLLAALGVLLFEAGKNLSAAPGRATRAWAAYLGGIAVGIGIAVGREPRVLWLGVPGAALAFFYHAPPFRLSRRGLGEAVAAAVYGPMIACGTFLTLRHGITGRVLLASIPLGLLAGAFLWAGGFAGPEDGPDGPGGGTGTREGPAGLRDARVFTGLVLGAYFLLLLLARRSLPGRVLLGLAGLPHGVAAARRLLAGSGPAERAVPARAWALLSLLLYAAGAGVGLLFALP
jgi:1,4-dihydroxy-2-naphthoate octaprenyltransferase